MNEAGVCCVCGTHGTADSHIFPRALVKAARGDEKHLDLVRKDVKGIEYTQSGIHDNTLLCDVHEAALGDWDAYGCRFLKNADKSYQERGQIFGIVSNSKPDYLVRFALACIWRDVASHSKGETSEFFGDKDELVRSAIFERADVSKVQLVLSKMNLKFGRNISRPFTNAETKYAWGQRVWDATIFGVQFRLKIDEPSWPQYVLPYECSQRNPAILIWQPDLMPIQHPTMRPTLLQAFSERQRTTPPRSN